MHVVLSLVVASCLSAQLKPVPRIAAPPVFQMDVGILGDPDARWTVSDGGSLRNARGHLGKMAEGTGGAIAVDLVIFGASGALSSARLAYRVHMAHEKGAGEVPFISDIYVDALDGRVLKSLSRVYTAGTPGSVSSNDLFGQNVTVDVTTFTDGTLVIVLFNDPAPAEIYTFDGSRNNVA